MSTVAFPLFREDAENVLTPSRRSYLERRWAAVLEARQIALEESHARAHGVLPKESKRHRFHAAPASKNLAGVLFADGEVHVFDRNHDEHQEYADRVRPGCRIMSGITEGNDGWGFILSPGEFWRYYVPEKLEAAVIEVLTAQGYLGATS